MDLGEKKKKIHSSIPQSAILSTTLSVIVMKTTKARPPDLDLRSNKKEESYVPFDSNRTPF